MTQRRGCCRRKKKTAAAAAPAPTPCSPATVTSQSPLGFGPNANASIGFDVDVTVNSFSVNVVGGLQPGPVSGGFTYNSVSHVATFTESPPRAGGKGGVAFATIVINQGTACERTITWTWTIIG